MHLRHISPFVILCCAAAAGFAADKKAAGTIVVNHAPSAPASMDPDLTVYYVGIITKGGNFDAYDEGDRARIQNAHIRNMEMLAKAGKILVAGPFSDSTGTLGLFIFKCATLAEAQTLASADPAVLAGRFRIEIHPWLTEKGAIRDPEFAPKK